LTGRFTFGWPEYRFSITLGRPSARRDRIARFRFRSEPEMRLTNNLTTDGEETMRRQWTILLATLAMLFAGLVAAHPAQAAPADPADPAREECQLYDAETQVWHKSENKIFHPNSHHYSKRADLWVRGNGNVLLKDECGFVRWRVQTGCPGAFMIFQGDGNLVIYCGRVPVWWTGTVGDGEHLALQDDGNFVIYDFYWKAVWNTGTAH
jgi:hypothetical protein